MVRRAAMAGVVVAMMLAACGGDDAEDDAAETVDSEPAGEAGEGAGSGDFCSDLEAIVGAGVELMAPIFGEDPAALEAAVADAAETYPDLAAAAVASAPEELAADVTTVTGETEALIEALVAVDLTDREAMSAAMEGSALFSGETEEAADRVSEHARTECGFDPDEAGEATPAGMGAEAATPPDACEFVDAQIVADAAGVSVDVTDQDGGGTFNLGVYATDGCSYANGAMSISTITYTTEVAEVAQTYLDSAEDNGGSVVTGVDLGGLPSSTVITEVHGYQSITVLEAPTAFSVGITDLADPAALVAAAEAVVAATS